MAAGVPKYITVRENLRQRIISMDPGEAACGTGTVQAVQRQPHHLASCD